MVSSLPIPADNLSEGLHKGRCKDCKSCLWYMNGEDGLLIVKCVECNKSYEKEFDEDLAKRFENTYKFCNGINKFCLKWGKGVYPSENRGSWQRFSEISLPEKKKLYSNLIIKDITDADYKHAKKSSVRVWNRKSRQVS